MTHRRYIVLILVILAVCVLARPVSAYWIWTPGDGKWENPKYAAKDTPEEQLAYAMGFYEEKNTKAGMREFKKLIKHYPLSKEAPTAQYYIGRILEDLDKPYAAFKAYQNVIDSYPYTEFVDEVIEREFNLGALFLEGKKFEVLGPLKVPAKDKAIEIFKAVADNSPYGKYADRAVYNAGLCYKDIIDYDSAILMFKEVMDKYPDSELVDSARYELAECSKLLSLKPDYDQTPTKVAREEFEKFIEKHPEDAMSGEARQIIGKLKHREAENAYGIGQFYESRRMYKSAAIYYRDIVENYPDTEWAGKAQERLNAIENK